MYVAGLGTEIPVQCPLTACESLMLKLCAARHQLRQVTTEKQRKQRELAGAEDKYARLTCGRSPRTATAQKACQILTSQIARLTSEIAKREHERLHLRAQLWNARDQYVQTCGALPSGFSSGKTLTIRKQGRGRFPCTWRQPC